ncbi:hypothetical protein HanIR_Chr08g0377591 [Helianthus annuus]|nr:hypothetical protein HanIR_Chr08g0377591 [Helianthus annuus]
MHETGKLDVVHLTATKPKRRILLRFKGSVQVLFPAISFFKGKSHFKFLPLTRHEHGLSIIQ